MTRKSLFVTGWLFLLLVLWSVTPPHRPPFCYMPGDPPPEDPCVAIFVQMLFAPIVGAIFAIVRLLTEESAEPMLQPICLRFSNSSSP